MNTPRKTGQAGSTPTQGAGASKTRSRLLVAFVTAVNAASLASIALLIAPGLFDRPLTLLILLALAAGVGARSIAVPRLGVKVVASDVFVLFSLIAIAPVAAPLVALASMIGTGLGGRTPLWSVKTAFNVGAVPLSMAAGAWTFVLLGGTSGAASPAILPLLAAAVVYALVNVPLTATAVALGSGRSWIAIVRQAAALAVVSNITCALAGAGLLLVWAVVGPIGLALGLVPLAPLEEYARSLSRFAGREERESTIVLELDDTVRPCGPGHTAVPEDAAKARTDGRLTGPTDPSP